ncbi:MAG: hypothetical protein M1819_001343 [Sarea resinae]|nr:MAG: hypothetical protein M1819_001343 [Sarea resinae]
MVFDEEQKYEAVEPRLSNEGLLRDVENEDDGNVVGEEESSSSFPAPGKRRSLHATLSSFSIVLNCVLLGICTFLLIKARRPSSPLPPWPSDVYSPAQDAIEYETVVFNSGFGVERNGPRKTPYLGPPSDEGDAAWLALYNHNSLTQIPASDAKRLPNATAEIPEKPGHYVVGLDVFHQLHCLNRIRKLLYPDRYPEKILDAENRWTHDGTSV